MKSHFAPPRTSRLFLAPLLMALAGIAGCHSTPIYRAAALPAEFAAPQFSSMRAIDLSRFSQSTGGSEMLQSGDLVSITISTGLETQKPVEWKGRIAEDSSINIPLVGSVSLAGMTLPQAEQLVYSESIRRGQFVNPNVTVQMVMKRSIAVTVMGAVTKPGTYQIPVTDSHVMAAISSAEGLTEDADTIIEIRHPSRDGAALAGQSAGVPSTSLASFPGGQNLLPGLPPRTVHIDLAQASVTGGADVHLEDGSTVMVKQRPKRYIHVMGLVRKPDQFEMPVDQELRLLGAISLANGQTLELADKVRIIRTVEGRAEPIVIEASIKEAKADAAANIRLSPGDVVSVEETAVTFVVGTIREFIRFGFTAGIPGL